MSGQAFDQLLYFIYFVYGLAFFGMGLTMALESGRSPALAEARLLRPLAAFGLIHGSHEWLEAYLLQAHATGAALPGWLDWARCTILVTSFLFLLNYGIRTFQTPGYRPLLGMRLGIAVLGIYSLVILASAMLTYWNGEVPWARLLDSLARYLLAVPGAALAALALRFESDEARSRDRRTLSLSLTVAAAGFGVYSLTQVFVPPLEMAPASFLNTLSFQSLAGFPIQLVRSAMAVMITLSLARATQEVEKERQQKLVTAQQARLEALEQVQAELTGRETLRRELLRHTVRAQEEERGRIARELHDETAQVLAAFGLDLATLQTMLPVRPDAQALVGRLQAHSREISQSLYRLVHDLRPAQLDDLGLVPALDYLGERAAAKGLELRQQIVGEVRRLEPVIETVLFRVAQEALNNVARHASTNQAEICLVYETQEVTLWVRDPGRGFNPTQSFIPPRGWGLAGMRERVESVGGHLKVTSAPEEGTTVEVAIPVFDLIP
ncbi:MAG: sensor histidine kinase [Anaerolineales bacterium]|nr:sensor histidine kinase [Anaerolineales bacterium]